MAEVRKTPKTSGREQAWWEMAHTLEDLVGEQVQLWESAERQERLLEELVSNTRVIVDAMDVTSGVWVSQALLDRKGDR